MEQITDKDYEDFYISLVNRIERYSNLHKKVIRLLLPHIKDYVEACKDLKIDIKDLIPQKIFTISEAEEITNGNCNVLYAVFNDFANDNLLIFQPNATEYSWLVTDIGYKCFQMFLDKSN